MSGVQAYADTSTGRWAVCDVYRSTLREVRWPTRIPLESYAAMDQAKLDQLFDTMAPRTGPAGSRAPAEHQPAGDLSMCDETVSFLCPLALIRITRPARGLHCRHRQCFDLSELRLDRNFLEWLRLHADVDRCIIRPDASSVIALDDDSDEEEHGTPAAGKGNEATTQRKSRRSAAMTGMNASSASSSSIALDVIVID
ncbi:hypothetical protein THASP1DRAFT_21417 [Thamnocephalis sphaerospora]|uniref:SP-RING-type domain-containing protein n=1 Tax=Thamnocephalis sphaerospora TaxID=78915 RepID=A0A4P9XX31_9FUNG|nr:hypothetical protein THASP1DRAFT_21417 [Thamnocephalis sphaerospora]|eukprot:RKP10915.1 hypothetical protein THASP1DRAFT_21417 [Thamnocephalis sphaerospora]